MVAKIVPSSTQFHLCIYCFQVDDEFLRSQHWFGNQSGSPKTIPRPLNHIFVSRARTHDRRNRWPFLEPRGVFYISNSAFLFCEHQTSFQLFKILSCRDPNIANPPQASNKWLYIKAHIVNGALFYILSYILWIILSLAASLFTFLGGGNVDIQTIARTRLIGLEITFKVLKMALST